MTAMRLVRITSVVVILALGLPVQALAAPKGDNGKGNGNGSGGSPPTSTATVMTAPYPDGRFNRLCERSATSATFEQCDAFGGWDYDGYVSTFSRVSSPQFGRFPQAIENRAWSRGEVSAVATLASPVERLPIHITFRVDEAEASVGGTSPTSLSPNTSATGGFILGLPGLPQIAHTLVDTSEATPEPETFSGEITITRELTNVPAGELTIWAGVGGMAEVGVGDAASTSLSIEATVMSISLGTPAPSPSPSVSPPTGPATAYTAPFAAEATTYSSRREVIPARSGEVQGATTADPETGEVTANLDTIGARVNCTPDLCVGSSQLSGQQGAYSSFIFHHSVPTPRTITVTAEWEIDQADVVHAMPCVYGCSYHVIGAFLSAEPADAWSQSGESGYEDVVPFGTAEIVTVADRTVTVEVTLQDAVGDIRIEAWMSSILSSSIGFSKLDLIGRLKSLTIR